ncbi:MAG: UvrD-helicase domain-containing protein [Nanoarchaeota archaeon]|nr:UvrD-helicase domain-containing protein [Nanoarchaeota archaeon]
MEFKPHIFILGAIKDSPVNIGRQLLAQVIVGEGDERTAKLRLNRMVQFGSLPLYDKKDVLELTDQMISKGLIELSGLPGNTYIKVLSLTPKGLAELKNPSAALQLGKSYDGPYKNIEKVTDEDRSLFEKLGDSLHGLSDEQKKAVSCQAQSILCIAGAGSGKTKVLTRRISFLSKYRSADSGEILAITFTRKAREEMVHRLDSLLPGHRVRIETFNSFCEKLLQNHELKNYGKKSTVLDYGTKVRMVMAIVKELGMNLDALLDLYYTDRKILSNDKKTLFLGFVNDIFSLLDYQSNSAIDETQLYSSLSDFPYIIEIIKKIKEMKKAGQMRDFTDQLVHAIELLKSDPESAPRFTHMLVDEYQDINSLQFALIQLLSPNNLFAVGDPRQSIYGWRGARIDYVLDFETHYKDAKVLQLSTNYRSTKNIVSLCNTVIKPMKLPDNVTMNADGESVSFVSQDSEDAEALFICQSIMSLDIPRKEIFVLARTNKQIENISKHMDSHQIKYLKRTTDETKQNIAPTDEQVTLSAIHAIKGLEADYVYVIGASAKNHPCHATEHPVLESVKTEVYDKNSEELRLLYVALSRARKRLIVSYSGSLSPFFGEKPKQVYKVKKSDMLHEELRAFRLDESEKAGVPAYQVFSDRTLEELCESKPTSLPELSEISGFGPFKLRKWGNKIIKIILSNT